MWALGVVVHELMTSEIPFLNTFQGLESMTITPELYTVGTSNFPPMLDAEILMDYCRGSEFPTECLQRKGVNEEGITFIKSVMVADPRRRPTATAVLNSPWLRNFEHMTTLRTQFGFMSIDLSHECIGKLLVEEDPTLINEMLRSPSPRAIRAMTFTAISLGALDVLAVLLKVTDDIDSIPGPEYISLIQFAAGQGKPEVIEFLLDSGANVNEYCHGKWSQTALHEAARGGHLEAINLLLDHGAEIDGSAHGDHSQTALHAAAAGGKIEAIKLLLDHGAGVDGSAPGSHSQTALHGAAVGGHLDAISLLLDRGADINGSAHGHRSQTALHAAAVGGHLDAMGLLLDRGADVNGSSGTQWGETALHGAASGGNLHAINLLLDRGADINGSSDTTWGQTALHGAASGGHVHAINLLLNRGATVNLAATTIKGQLPLFEAARCGHLEAMKLLFQRGAHVDESLPYSPGTTALYAAALGGHIDAVKFLLDRGAVVSRQILSLRLTSPTRKLLESRIYTQRRSKPSLLPFSLVPGNLHTPTGNGIDGFGSW